MSFKLSVKQVAMFAAAASLSFSAASSFASAFQLYEQSAAGTGDYHAGYAAEADDASTEFYNPAGMTRLKHPEVSVGGVLIPLSASYNGQVLTLGALTGTTADWVDGDTTNFVPNLHIVYPFSKHWAAGFGITVPFGLATSYPWSGVSQFAATVTRLQAINFNPNLAYAFNDHLSVGVGFDVVYGTATYDAAVGVYFPPPFTSSVSQFKNSLSDTSYGWNAGALYQFNPDTRIGISYRSSVVLHATGTSSLAGVVGTGSTDALHAKLTLPDYATLSIFSSVTPKWDVMGTAMWTNWNQFHTLNLNNTALSFSPLLVAAGIGPNLTVHENYHNSWNFALGAHYHVNPRMTLKWGGGFDMTPTRDGYRDMRLPDSNRVQIAAGLQAKLTKWLTADLGWSHVFSNQVHVDSTKSGSPVDVNGTGRMSADLFGLQLTAAIMNM